MAGATQRHFSLRLCKWHENSRRHLQQIGSVDIGSALLFGCIHTLLLAVTILLAAMRLSIRALLEFHPGRVVLWPAGLQLVVVLLLCCCSAVQ